MVYRGRRIVLSRTDYLLYIAKMINQVYIGGSNSDKGLTKSDELAALQPDAGTSLSNRLHFYHALALVLCATKLELYYSGEIY
jgi:hypothetical protein